MVNKENNSLDINLSEKEDFLSYYHKDTQISLNIEKSEEEDSYGFNSIGKGFRAINLDSYKNAVDLRDIFLKDLALLNDSIKVAQPNILFTIYKDRDKLEKEISILNFIHQEIESFFLKSNFIVPGKDSEKIQPFYEKLNNAISKEVDKMNLDNINFRTKDLIKKTYEWKVFNLENEKKRIGRDFKVKQMKESLSKIFSVNKLSFGLKALKGLIPKFERQPIQNFGYSLLASSISDSSNIQTSNIINSTSADFKLASILGYQE